MDQSTPDAVLIPPPLQEPNIALDQRTEFPRPPATSAVLWALAALGCLAIAALGFFAALKVDTGPFKLQLMTTVPIMGALALFGKAFLSRRGVLNVIADQQGLTLHYANRTDNIPWDRIAWNSEGAQFPTNLPQSTLFDNTGKVLAKIPSILVGWDQLILRINRRVKANPTAAAELVRRKKLKRQGLLLVGFFLFGTALVSLLTISELDKRRQAKLLESSAVEGTATLQRKFTAPNGHTRRIEYRVDTKSDEKTPDLVNIEVDPLLWELLTDGQKIPVRYVPSDPNISHLLVGQRDDDPADRKTFLIIPAFSILLLIFLTGGIFNLRGIDLVIDSETKKLRVARSVAK